MSHAVSPRLIETVVRKTLREAKDSPERSLRNLVDLARYFSASPAQQRFFDCAHQLLRDEHSPYYPLIRDLLSHVEEERLISFGMALGYNSCVAGSRTRRALADQGIRVPWFLTLQTLPGQTEPYQGLVRQGRELGIYTYALLPREAPWELLPLVDRNRDCAFILFCCPEDMTTPFLEEAESLTNLVLAVRCQEEAETACQRLRERNFLYALYTLYGEERDLPTEEFFCLAEHLHAPLALFLPRPECPPEALQRCYQQVDEVRRCQPCRTIPWEFLQDGLTVDQMIGGGVEPVWFNRDGFLCSIPHEQALSHHTLFDRTLEELFQESVSKAN